MSRLSLRVPVCLAVAVLLMLATAASAYASASGVVISEFRFRGPAGGNDEFVELMNTASSDRDISGWKLEGCAAASGAPSNRATVPAGIVLKPGQHYLFTNNGPAGYSNTSVPGDRNYSTGLADTGGARIVTSSNAFVDGVGSLDGATDLCREGAGLFLPASPNGDYSFERRDGGRQDTDDNVADFVGPKTGDPQNFLGPRDPVVVRIHEIQGAGAESALTGETVIVEAIVTGVDDEVGYSVTTGQRFSDDAGIFLQEEAAEWDADAATSEAIFVGFVSSRMSLEPGTVVRVQGQVTEKFGLTQLNETFGLEPTILADGVLPTPVTISRAQAEAQDEATKPYYESLESMRVRIETAVANSGGTNKFGELFLTPGTERNRVFRTEAAPSLIGTDADAGAGNPFIPPRDPDGSTTVVNADLFDRVDDVVGPLAFSFTNYKVMVQPDRAPTVTKGPIAYPYTGVGPLDDYQIRVASYNVENFFPVGGDLDGGTVTTAEYEEKKNRIADAIGRLLRRPDVVAVQEVVDRDILADLALTLGGYTAYLEEGNDSRGIDVGYLVKDTVAASNVRQLGKAATTTRTDCADGTVSGTPLLFDRPPLAIDITAGAATFTVVTNHFASKSHPDACRNQQAAFVRDFVAGVEAAGGHAVVAGDLNAFEDETPLAILEDGTTTLSNLWWRAPAEERYSYSFQGKLQTLDHILITDGLEVRAEGFLYAHLDNDYYERGDAADGHKLSDHDPPVLVISTSACPGGDERSTVFVGPIDTGVPNDDSGDGCSVNDLIVEDAEYRNQGAWVSHVAVTTNELVAAGVLRGDEKGRIESAAARWQNR